MPDGDRFDYDVFISYSSEDNEWVRRELLHRIEQAGLKAFIDFRDFRAGVPSIKECERGVVSCRKTLLILTPKYVASPWTQVENIMALTLDPANESLRVIPLLKAECKKPLRIGVLTHIDFTDGADQELAWRQLLTALGKPPKLEPPTEPQLDEWFLAHPYPMPPNFTGRLAERAMLTSWLNEDAAHPLLSLRALGGFGKSALVWHWLTHDVQPDAWPRVVWWSFYAGDASFAHFVTETLDYLSGAKVDAAQLPEKDTVKKLLEALLAPGTLLVLDGSERILRAFGGLGAAYQGDEARCEDSDRDCISPLADLFLRHVALQPEVRSKVLLTTRLCPRVLEAKGGGLLARAREEPLEQMTAEDAVAFFHAQGIRGTHTEIETACESYGYHPLSLRLLAGLIVADFQQSGDIAAARRLDVSGDLVQCQHHVLEVAYDRLMPSQQALLGRISCSRGPLAYDTLKALAETEGEAKAQGSKDRIWRRMWRRGSSSQRSDGRWRGLDADLRGLVARGLLQHDPRRGWFDLHPIVRRYAYDREAAPERAAAHIQLRDYFVTVPMPDKVARLEDLAPAIELYHHTVRARQLDEACNLYGDRLATPLFYQFGAYQLCIDLLRTLFPDGEDYPPRLKKESDRSWALNELANAYSYGGQPRCAIRLLERLIEQHLSFDGQPRRVRHDKGWLERRLAGEDDHERIVGVGLMNIAQDQLKIGATQVAEVNLRRAIALCREREDLSAGHIHLGLVLAYRGAHAESQAELTTAQGMVDRVKWVQAQTVVWTYRTVCELLHMRQTVCDSNRKSQVSSTVLASGRRALELVSETAHAIFPFERDCVLAHWVLGAAYHVAGQQEDAERHLHEALERCRRINMVESEANILIDLARLRSAAGSGEDARRLTEEALLITERSSYVLQGADAHIELAKLARGRGDRAAAREHAEEARRLATCDGPPDYTYAAAYAESSALLAQL